MDRHVTAVVGHAQHFEQCSMWMSAVLQRIGGHHRVECQVSERKGVGSRGDGTRSPSRRIHRVLRVECDSERAGTSELGHRRGVA
jgi:hypothetical protein